MDASARFTDALAPRLSRIERKLGRTPHVCVRAPRLDLTFDAGPSAEPFHAASVGKIITAALVMQCVEDGSLRLDTPVADVLAADEIAGLFLPGTPATVEHLLTHTSGVADYFEGRVTGGAKAYRLAIAEPQRVWTPEDLLRVSRERQVPVGRPGQKFSYSDTGFVLLGRILEEATGEDFVALAHRRIFDRVGLASAFYPFRSTPADGTTTLAPLLLDRTDVSAAPSLTIDWAGGGMAATASDMARLGAALHDGTLVTPESMAVMSRPRNKFRPGLAYGAGTMTAMIEGFAPWLRGYPRLVGHIGITAAHLWHDPTTGTDIVVNLGDSRRMATSFRLLIEVLALLRRG